MNMKSSHRPATRAHRALAPKTPRSRGFTAATLLAAMIAAGSTAQAATIDWTGTTDTTWATGTNWTGGVAPSNNLTTDIALFNLTLYPNQPDAGTTSVYGIQIGDGTTSTAALTIGGTALTLGSGGITMNANAGAATITAPITLGAKQTWTNNSTNTLSVGSIAPTAGSGTSVKFAGTGTINTTTTNTNGILGAWAVTGMAGTAGATGDWAAVDGSGNVGTYSGYTTITGSMGAADYSAQNWKVTNAVAALTASATVNSLVVTTDFSVSSGATMTVGSGGIILSGNSRWLKNNGAGSTAGTGQITSGLASGELFIYSSGSSSSDSDWRIWTKIVNNGGTAVKLVKDGPGYLRLENTNTYTGGTIVNGGTLVATGVNSLSSGPVQVNSGALLTVDATNNTTINGNFSGAGTVTFQNTISGNYSYSIGGDWSGFTGTLNYNSAARTTNFFAPDSMDLSHATVVFASSNVNSSFRTSATGTTKFGSLAGFGALWTNGATEIGHLGTNTTFSGVISQAGGITKVGAGTLTLSGANTYTGATTVNAGTLALGAANRIADTSALVLAGGTFATGGFSETLNTLTLSGSSILDFGSGTSALVFADSSAISWSGTLTLINFDIGTDTLKFGASISALTLAQLNEISLAGYTASLDSGGFVTFSAIPEPSTYAVLLGVASFGGMLVRRRFAKKA